MTFSEEMIFSDACSIAKHFFFNINHIYLGQPCSFCGLNVFFLQPGSEFLGMGVFFVHFNLFLHTYIIFLDIQSINLCYSWVFPIQCFWEKTPIARDCLDLCPSQLHMKQTSLLPRMHRYLPFHKDQ